jgi:hypothetical protein
MRKLLFEGLMLQKIKISMLLAILGPVFTSCKSDMEVEEGKTEGAKAASDGIPSFSGKAEDICTGDKFVDADGKVVEGTRNCTTNAEECTSDGAVGCLTTSSFKAADMTKVTAGNIRSGITIAGVTGAYPSSTYLLSGASSTADLTSSTFSSRVKSASAFEYWDSTGTRQTGTGDADIVPSKIKDGVAIFGETGTVEEPVAPNAWDIRIGKVVNGVTGKLKVNCRNLANTVLYDNTTAPAVSGLDKFDTIDNFNNGSGAFPSENPWGSADYVCDEDNWQDVSVESDGTTSTACSQDSDECMFKDLISGLIWTEYLGAGDWETAITTCEGLTHGNVSDWRVPTQMELMTAYVHGMFYLFDDQFISFAEMSDKMWSSSTQTDSLTSGLNTGFGNGAGAFYNGKNPNYGIACVR